MADTTDHLPPDKVANLTRLLLSLANIVTIDSVLDTHQSVVINSFVMEQTAGMSPLEALIFATPLIEKLKLELTISAAAALLSLQPFLSTLAVLPKVPTPMPLNPPSQHSILSAATGAAPRDVSIAADVPSHRPVSRPATTVPGLGIAPESIVPVGTAPRDVSNAADVASHHPGPGPAATVPSPGIAPEMSLFLNSMVNANVVTAALALRSSDERRGSGVPQTVNTRNGHVSINGGDDASSITTSTMWIPLPLSFPSKPNSRELTLAMRKKCSTHICQCVHSAKKSKPYRVRYSKPKRLYVIFQCPCQTSQIKVLYSAITPHSTGWFAHYNTAPNPSSSAGPPLSLPTPHAESLSLSFEIKDTIQTIVASNPTMSCGAVAGEVTRAHQLNPNGDGTEGTLFRKITDHVKYLKSRQGATISTLADVLEWVQTYTLESCLPPHYTARSNYQTVQELQIALCLDTEYSLITLPILPTDLAAAANIATISIEDRTKCTGSFLVTSPAHLFTLLQFCRDDTLQGLRFLHCDESMKFLHGAEQLLSLGCCDIDLHSGPDVTHSYRPVGHYLTACKTFAASFVFYAALARVANRLFGIELHPDGFLTDYSAALRKGLSSAALASGTPAPVLIICYAHIIARIDGPWKTKYNLSPNERSLLFRHLRILHEAKTWEAFCCLFALVLAKWRSMELVDFADYFEAWYGPTSPCQGLWYLNASPMVYIIPSNNPLENYWKEVKGNPSQQIPPVVSLNVSAGQFLKFEISKLLEHDFRRRCGVSVERKLDRLGWRPLSFQILGITALMDFDADVHVVGNHVRPIEFYVNNVGTLNRFISPERIDQYEKAHHGLGEWLDPEIYGAAQDSLCHVLVVSATFHPELLSHSFHGLFCYCSRFKNSRKCHSSIFLQDYLVLLMPCLEERYTATFSTRAGAVRLSRRRRRYVMRWPLPPGCAIHQGLGVPFGQDMPKRLLYLFGLTISQMKVLRLMRGVNVPDMYFSGDHHKGHLTIVESLEVLLAGTALGTYVCGQQQRQIVASLSIDRFAVAHNTLSSTPVGFIGVEPLMNYAAPTNNTAPEDGGDGDNDVAWGSYVTTEMEPGFSPPLDVHVSVDGNVHDVHDKMAEGDDNDEGVAPNDRQLMLVTVGPSDEEQSSVLNSMVDPLFPLSVQPYIVDSYQGAHNGTVSACVVISYLLVTYHLRSPPEELNLLTANGIKEIIDNMTRTTIATHSLRDPTAQDLTMYMDSTLKSLQSNLWPKLRIPSHSLVFRMAYDFKELATLVPDTIFAPLTSIIDQLDSDLQEHMKVSPTARVGAIFHVQAHQFCILRGRPIAVDDSSGMSDYQYHAIDSLLIPSEQGCLHLVLKGTRAVWRYLKRRCAVVAPANILEEIRNANSIQDSSMTCVLEVFKVEPELSTPDAANPDSYFPIDESSFGTLLALDAYEVGEGGVEEDEDNVYEDVEHEDAGLCGFPDEEVSPDELVPCQGMSSVLDMELLRHISQFVCTHIVCPSEPWLLLPNDNHGTVLAMTCSTISTAMRGKTWNEAGNLMIHSYLYDELGDDFIRGAFTRVRQQLSGRSDLVIELTVDNFSRYSPTVWFNNENIDEFLKELSVMQHGEYHPRADLMAYSRETSELTQYFQRRLLPEESPRTYFFLTAWCDLLFANAITFLLNNFATNEVEVYLQQAPSPVMHARMRARPNPPRGAGRRTRRGENITDPNAFHSLVFPMNIHRLHWYTVVVHNVDRTIYLYDFLHPRGNNARSAQTLHIQFQHRVVDEISSFLQVDRAQRGLSRVTWKRHLVVGTKLQRDGSSCGVLLSRVAWFTAYHRRPPTEEEVMQFDFGQQSINLFRQWMALSYLQDRIWIPPLAETLVDTIRPIYLHQQGGNFDAVILEGDDENNSDN